MSNRQRSALFWVFLVFFIGIGVASLLVALGVFPNADPAFRKFAIGTFIAGIAGALFTLFRTTFMQRQDLFVTLLFEGKLPQEVALAEAARYEVWDEKQGKVVRSGQVLVQRTPQRGWFCRLPNGIDVNDRLRLLLEERNGDRWEVPFFSFNFSSQEATRK